VGASKPDTPDLDDLDSGWGDEDEEAVDAGWEDPEAPEPEELVPKGLTPAEREARAAARKERLRAKAAGKAERRKARAAAAAAKQKKGVAKAAAVAPERRVDRRPPRRVEKPVDDLEEKVTAGAPERVPVVSRTARSRRDWRPIALLVVLLVVAGGVALFLSRR
jgi:hypothetical protein